MKAVDEFGCQVLGIGSAATVSKKEDFAARYGPATGESAPG